MLEQIHEAKESLWITRINPIKNQSVTAVLSSWSTKFWTPLRGEASPWSWAVTGGKWTLRAQGCNKWFPKAMNPRAVTQRSCPALSLALCSASAGPAQHPCPALTWATHRTQRSPTPGHWFLSLGALIFVTWGTDFWLLDLSPCPQGLSCPPCRVLVPPLVFVRFSPELAQFYWGLGHKKLRAESFMENLELPGRACSALSQLSVLLKTNVTLIYHSPKWSWKEFENYCLL